MQILLADDDAITLKLLETTLKRLNYQVVLAHNGREAWQILQESPVEIALLDWMMPGMDGLELCRRLQALGKSRSQFTYTILLTANDRTEDITAGLDAGANDYITKPFDLNELKSRIAVGVRIVEYESRLQKMNEELRRYSLQMEALAQERANQLVQADRMVMLGTMTAGIAHEINNPLTILQGNIKLMKKIWNNEYAAQQVPVEKSNTIDIKYVPELLSALESAVVRIRNIIDGMRKFSHGKGGEVQELILADCIQDALSICLPKTKNHADLKIKIEEIPFPLKGNPVQITQVLVNLIGNAADALAGTLNPSITVSLTAQDSRAQLQVADNGPGIQPENLEKLWSPFYTTKPVGIGTGLGLFICRTIVAEHGGKIQVTSEPGAGTAFLVELPNQADYEKFLAAKEQTAKDTGV